MSGYQSIKDIVIDTYMSEGEFPSYEKLTSLVKANFPNSKWQKSHYSWYKSQIKTGKIEVSGVETAVSDEKEISDIESNIEESIEASVSLERDLHNWLTTRLSEIEPGLILVDGGVEYQTEAGRIDILAKDQTGGLVVIEIKAGKAKDGALGQLLGYIGCLSATTKKHENIRGILIASNFDSRVIFAVKGLRVKLVKYQLSFKLEEIL
ncbi:MAG: endonuclease NucS [Planctomycetota bacterium]|nr:endonuclease NucS [Planctomycetota bacterium]